jgi:hypothetical protein
VRVVCECCHFKILPFSFNSAYPNLRIYICRKYISGGDVDVLGMGDGTPWVGCVEDMVEGRRGHGGSRQVNPWNGIPSTWTRTDVWTFCIDVCCV